MAEKQKKQIVTEVSEEKTIISSQNLTIIILIVMAAFLLIFFIYRWQKVNDKSKFNASYLIDNGAINLEIKNLEEVSQILTEAPTEYFVLVTYTGNEATYDLEVGIKDIIDKYNLSDSFYYFNADGIKDEDNYITRLNNAFNTDKIKNVPVILYFQDGKVVDTVTRVDNNIIKAADFQKLLDIYQYEGQ